MIDLHLTLEEAEDVKSAVMSRLLHLDNRIREVEGELPGWTKWLEVRRADRERAINEFLLIDNAIKNWLKEFGPDTIHPEMP